jgi:hypothetical protein
MSTCDFSRPELLSVELERRGLGCAAAESVAWLLIARHPFACRVGVPAFTRELMRRGLSHEAAHSAALMLAGLEMFDGGFLFDHVSRAEALEASALHRHLQCEARRDPAFTLRRRLEIAGFGIAAVLVFCCLALL